MGLAGMAAKAASKVANKAKNGIKNKLNGKGKDDSTKEFLKKALLIKVGIPAGLAFIVIACISIILQQLFEDTSSTITVSSQKIKDSFDAGELTGDASQIDLAMSLQGKYGSLIGFTTDQIKIIYDDTIESLEGQDATYSETYTSNYGTVTQEVKNDITNKYNEANNRENKREEDYDIINYYNLSREGKFNNMISPYDKRPIYMHALYTEKYNFNNISWKAYYHDSDEVNDVSKDNLTYDTTYQLLYPTGADLKDLINLTSPYLMTSHIPLAFISSAMYSSSLSNQSIGTSWVEQNEAEAQGKNNNIGNFAYEIIKHGYSDITINQYNLQSVTRSSYWLDYDTYECIDKIQIKKEIIEEENDDGSITKREQYSVVSYEDGTTNLSNKTGHTNTRWDGNQNKEVPANEYTVSDDAPLVTVIYKLASAHAFDVKINNSFNYEKYSQEDVDKRENCDSVLSETESDHTKVENEDKHITSAELEGLKNNQEELKRLWEEDGNTNETGTRTVQRKYNYQVGKRHDITRYWTDSVSSNPTSQSKTLFSTGDVASYNENTDGDLSMDTISKSDFEADTDSKNYYDTLAEEEGTAINRIDMLNANPKVFLNYVDNANKRAKYVGYSRSDYTYSQGLEYLIEYLTELAEQNNGVLPFVYGASFGFDVNAAAAGTSSYSSGMSLLREYINSWEDPGDRMRTESGNVTSNEEEAVFYAVYIDDVGVPTVGFGINLNSQFNDVKSAFEEAGIEFPYGSASDIKSRVESGEVVTMDKKVIDSVQEEIIERKLDMVKSLTNGIELTQYQLFALTDRAYNGWNNIHGKTFSQAYNEYWKQDTDDKYETLYDKYKDNQGAKDSIIAEIDFNNALYTNFLRHTTGNEEQEAQLGGWTTRRKSEFVLFSGGYFAGGYSMDKMLRFYTSTTSPGDVQLIKADGTVDETACYALQQWFEQNWFSGKISPADTNVHQSDWNNQVCDADGVDTRGVVNQEFVNKYDPLNKFNVFECAWWSFVRANQFLVDNNTGKKLTTFVNGVDEADKFAELLGLQTNSDINQLRPNSIISWYPNHTGYVEAVTDDYYITSECGSGWNWYGITIHPKVEVDGNLRFKNSVCLEDLL